MCVGLYTLWHGHVPTPSRRAGARRGALSEEVRSSLRSEVKRLDDLPDPLAQAKAVGDFFAALDAELESVAAVRLEAVQRLRAMGWSYDRIARETGLSKGRVAQLVKDPRGH